MFNVMQGKLFASRHELKYIVEESKAESIRHQVCAHLATDPFSDQTRGYDVSSLYLDSPTYELYAQTARGQRNRFKLRVRFYSEDTDDPVFFEIKRRDGAVVRKQRSAVRRSSVDRILNGGVPALSDLHESGGDLSVMNEFCRLRQGIGAYGYTYVGYRREAFGSGGTLSNVRVTFDRDLVAGNHRVGDPLLILPPDISPRVGGVILELKFTDRFPRWMHDLVQVFQLERTSVPKYNTCVDALGVQVLPNGDSFYQ